MAGEVKKIFAYRKFLLGGSNVAHKLDDKEVMLLNQNSVLSSRTGSTASYFGPLIAEPFQLERKDMMKTSTMILTAVGLVALIAASLLDGPRLVRGVEAASVTGGDCTDFANSECDVAGDCTGFNLASHFFNNCGPGSQGAVCVRCSNGPDTIFGCQAAAVSSSCGPHPSTRQDCGHEVFGTCDGNGNCSQTVPDEEALCNDPLICCQTP